MKKYIIEILIILAIIGITALAIVSARCSAEPAIPILKSPQVIANWIWYNIEYKSDMEVHGVIEYFQMAGETLELRTGDCEDLAILFHYFMYKINRESIVVIMGLNKNKGHAVTIYKENNRYYVFDNFEIIKMPKKYKWITEIVNKHYKGWVIRTRIYYQ